MSISSNFITHLIILVLGECDTVDSLELFKARIATQIFSGLADVALLGAILLPLTSYLQILIGANPKAVKIIHSVVVGIISLLMVVYIGISSYNYGDYEAIMYGDTQNLFDVANKLGVAVYVLYMLAVVLASVANLITLLQFNSKRVAAGSLNALVPLLCLCMLLWSNLIVVLSVYYGLQSHNLTMAGDIAFQYIINTSYFLVFVFLILIAGSNTVAAAVAPQTATQPVYSPVPVYGGTAQPQYGVPQAGYQSPPPQAGYQSLQPQSYTGYQPPPQQVNAYQAPVQQYQQPYQQPYQNP
jgi:hypothetical protein